MILVSLHDNRDPKVLSRRAKEDVQSERIIPKDLIERMITLAELF